MEHFTINGSLFLAFAEFVYYLKSNSTIYKMDESTGRFKLYQTLQNNGSLDIEYFTIGKKHFLAVDSIYHGTNDLYAGTNFSPHCLIYQWNGKLFVVIQKIPRKAQSRFTFFTINGDKYLAVSNLQSWRRPTEPHAFIYKWTGSQFNKFQEVATEADVGCDAFEINYETFIAFANANYSQQSAVFKWIGERFVKVQSLHTFGAYNVKSFQINGHTFLAFSDDFKKKNDSFIFKWNGNQFDLFQSIPTRGARALHPFVISGQTFLGVVNTLGENEKFNTKSVVYQASGSRFVNYQEIPTHGAVDMTTFEYKGDTYLAVANFLDEKKFTISVLYKWV